MNQNDNDYINNNLLIEDDKIDFTEYNQLSYCPTGINNYVELYVDDFFIGVMEVWEDSEMNQREYLTINHEIVYLDTIRNNS
jgi:uncharacterized protein YuzB (UPF0349 family)